MQLKFLEERKKAKALATDVSVSGTSAQGMPASSVSSVWRYLNGDGALGTYTALRNVRFGTVIELWHGNSTILFLETNKPVNLAQN